MDITEMVDRLSETEDKMGDMLTVTFFSDGSGHVMIGEYGEDREIFQFDTTGELGDYITIRRSSK